MSLHRFFLPEQIIEHVTDEQFTLRLTDDDVKHAKVLRLEPGEHIAVIDADHNYYDCEIISFDTQLIVRVAEHKDAPVEPFFITLFQGCAKGSKMDDIICHATELGVGEFVPFFARRSVVKLDDKRAQKRHERWCALAKSAAMQSGSSRIPRISDLLPSDQVKDALASFDLVLVFWEEASHTCTLKQAFAQAQQIHANIENIAVVVGPEGGFEEEEVRTFLSSNDASALVSLGSRILRCETAALIASALTIYECGGLGA